MLTLTSFMTTVMKEIIDLPTFPYKIPTLENRLDMVALNEIYQKAYESKQKTKRRQIIKQKPDTTLSKEALKAHFEKVIELLPDTPLGPKEETLSILIPYSLTKVVRGHDICQEEARILLRHLLSTIESTMAKKAVKPNFN